MKIVVDISEKDYKDVVSCGGAYYDFGSALIRGVKLPEGLGRAIMTLLDEYSNAVESDYVIKPISYASYQTWRIWDAKEKPRAERRENEQRE